MGLASACVTEPLVTLTITISPGSVILTELGETGERRVFRAIVKDQHGREMEGVKVSWSTSDSSVVTVSGDGMVGLVKVAGDGSANVSASVGAVKGTAVAAVRIGSQLSALLALYRGLGGDGWCRNANWATDAPLDTWYGLTIDSDGNVTRLVMSVNELIGRIPPQIGMLESLEVLHLTYSKLTGPIPRELGNLQRLRHIGLESNELTGPIPSELGYLPQLKSLILAENDLTGPIPPDLGNLHQLRELALQANRLTGVIPLELGNLQQVLSLQLSWNGLTGPIPPELGNLQELRWMSLFGNDLSGPVPPELGNLQSLEYLFLSDNDLTGPVPPELGSFENLSGLTIANTALSGRLPRELISIPLQIFYWNESNLCAPADLEFQEWLASIHHHGGNRRCSS